MYYRKAAQCYILDNGQIILERYVVQESIATTDCKTFQSCRSLSTAFKTVCSWQRSTWLKLLQWTCYLLCHACTVHYVCLCVHADPACYCHSVRRPYLEKGYFHKVHVVSQDRCSHSQSMHSSTEGSVAQVQPVLKAATVHNTMDRH